MIAWQYYNVLLVLAAAYIAFPIVLTTMTNFAVFKGDVTARSLVIGLIVGYILLAFARKPSLDDALPDTCGCRASRQRRERMKNKED